MNYHISLNNSIYNTVLAVQHNLNTLFHIYYITNESNVEYLLSTVIIILKRKRNFKIICKCSKVLIAKKGQQKRTIKYSL